jgi:ATP-dependent DNA helicase DinG
MANILDFWSHPESEPRVTQIKALEWLEKQTAKYLILEAPVGAGKSHIGITFAESIQSQDRRKSFVLTPQKILQEQYEKSFARSKVFAFYGKGNYNCAKYKSTCDIGSLVKPSCETCPYRGAKEIAKITPHVVLNYKLALLSFRYAGVFNPRPLMILDECHNTEHELCELDAIEISEIRCKRYGIQFRMCKTIHEALTWIAELYLPPLIVKLQDMNDKTEPMRNGTLGRDLTATELNMLREFNSLAEHAETLQWLVEESVDNVQKDFALIYDKKAMKFKRLYAGFSFRHVLQPRAERFLFMSSTILNQRGFCNDLGINQSEAAFLSMDSEFPHENRPVIFIPTMKMNKDWNEPENERGRDRMIVAMSHILEMHEHDSGIVHTASFAIAKWMTEALSTITSHEIMHHNPESGMKREKVIEAFKNSEKPCILFSPSITEGLDLVGDIARFAVFAKVPYPFLGDQWIFTRKLISDEWYARQALIEIIQGGGRVVRSKTDWGFVYILDSSWNYLMSKTRPTIPEWWMEAYREMS